MLVTRSSCVCGGVRSRRRQGSSSRTRGRTLSPARPSRRRSSSGRVAMRWWTRDRSRPRGRRGLVRTTRAPSCRVSSTQGSGVVALSHKLWLFLRISVRRPLAPVALARAPTRAARPAETEHAPRGSTRRRVACDGWALLALGARLVRRDVLTTMRFLLAGYARRAVRRGLPPDASVVAVFAPGAPRSRTCAPESTARCSRTARAARESRTPSRRTRARDVAQRVRARPNLLVSSRKRAPASDCRCRARRPRSALFASGRSR